MHYCESHVCVYVWGSEIILHVVGSSSTAQLRNRIEMVFRTSTASSGVILWTGSSLHDRAAPLPPSESNPHRRGYLGLFIADGFLELRIDLDLSKSDEQPVIIRSKVCTENFITGTGCIQLLLTGFWCVGEGKWQSMASGSNSTKGKVHSNASGWTGTYKNNTFPWQHCPCYKWALLDW